MSTFLTPPVWYDKNGNLIEMLTGKSVDNSSVVIGSSAKTEDVVTDSIVIYGYVTGDLAKPADNAIVIGKAASVSASGAIAIGGGNSVVADGAIAIGHNAGAGVSGAVAIGDGAIAIGRNAGARASGAIAIGDGASATSPNTIQLGKSDTKYTLQVGNGTGTSKIGALSFNSVSPTGIASSGLYWCTAEQTLSAAGTQQIRCCNAFLWIGSVNSTTASATDGAATFTYEKQEGQSSWAIRVSGSNVSDLKCYKVFA